MNYLKYFFEILKQANEGQSAYRFQLFEIKLRKRPG